MVPPSRSLEDFTDLVSLAEVNQRDDPQTYARLRGRWGEVAPVELVPGIPVWLVMGYQEIIQVSRDERLFSRDSRHWRYLGKLQGSGSPLALMMTPQEHSHFADGEKHRRLRAPLDDGLEGLDEHRTSRATQAICLGLIAKFADRREADLVTEYAALVPMLAVASWFGIGTDDAGRLMEAMASLFVPGQDPRPGMEIMQQILSGLILAHQEDPVDDLTTALLRHPNYHDASEVTQAIVQLLAAGQEATVAWIAQTLRLILADSHLGGRLRGGRLGVEEALDEVLWRRPPAANIANRYALADCEIAGTRIRKGDALAVSYAAANTDPRVHGDDPWLEIGNRAHLAWGAGPHVCPAQRPSRTIVRIAVETVLTRLHDLRLAVPAEEISTAPSISTVCPAGLPVRFTGFS
ncbi:cytochrome P450 [Amycolatopsis pigmentata]|uniref:Cytochrome P450 n=1 Tax=Amycolatopsis pigmentata TaxID=450801 RepID=A0ABW5G1D5_9PSEU